MPNVATTPQMTLQSHRRGAAPQSRARRSRVPLLRRDCWSPAFRRKAAAGSPNGFKFGWRYCLLILRLSTYRLVFFRLKAGLLRLDCHFPSVNTGSVSIALLTFPLTNATPSVEAI